MCYRGVEDVEVWLEEVESHLASEELGKVNTPEIESSSIENLLCQSFFQDLTGVQNLMKKHNLLEADVLAHKVQNGRDLFVGCC